MKKTLIDTNVIVRLFVKDDIKQLQKSEAFFKNVEEGKKTAVVSVLVIFEIIWIIEKIYKVRKKDFLPQFIQFLFLKNIEILEAKKEIIIETLKIMMDKNVDFTDAYLFCSKNGNEIFSFDSDFGKLRKK